MKANEAPEKIFLKKRKKETDRIHHLWCRTPVVSSLYEHIEYTRTDVFIEKACAWIKESISNNTECNRIISKKGVITVGELIKDFKNYMKGE